MPVQRYWLTMYVSLLLSCMFFGTFTWAQNSPKASTSGLRGPGEGLWHPGQIEVPEPVRRAFQAVVRIHDHDMRLRLTLFETADAASTARKGPHALDKEFTQDGRIVWPILLSRPDLEKMCSTTSGSLSPGFFDLCQAMKLASCVAYPCTVTTKPIASYASGVAVARLSDGMDVILTAYHVAREVIERHERIGGQYKVALVAINELSVEYSNDPLQPLGPYHSATEAYLLANASEKDWHDGRDWALLGVPSSEASVTSIPLASQNPKEGDAIWILGFPFRTRRFTARTLGYDNANNDFRVSYGLAVGAEDLGTNPPYVLTNADIVSVDSGRPLINSHGEVVGIVHNSLCKPDGENDLSIEKFCGLTLATSVDAVRSTLFNLNEHKEPH